MGRSTASWLSDCIDGCDGFNRSGDDCDDGDPSHSRAMFDSHVPANPSPCEAAFGAACSVLVPGFCPNH
jgi:hypothetical protein